MLSEPRPKCAKRSPSLSQPLRTLREGEGSVPRPGSSTRMTRAPSPARSCAAVAPARQRLALTTVIPRYGATLGGRAGSDSPSR
jgi:hypothetical protein